MDGLDLNKLGLQEVDGAGVYGGETIAPLGVALIVCAVGYLVANWSDFKRGVADGYNGT